MRPSRIAPRLRPLPPVRDGLYDPTFERDSCGVGFVAHLNGRKSHATVQSGLQVLRNLQHRGACGCDQDTGDGAGILLQMPDPFFRAQAGRAPILNSPSPATSGSRSSSCPRTGPNGSCASGRWSRSSSSRGRRFLAGGAFRSFRQRLAGSLARKSPRWCNCLSAAAKATAAGEAFERALYVIRRQAERWAAEAKDDTDSHWFAIPSCSARTIVYKGMLKADQLGPYFPDLADPRMESALALVHSRYSTNTFPQWGLAQPFHMLAHNGEINTLSGNVHWLRARQPRMSGGRLGDDLKKVLPLEYEGLSDSAILDQTVELLVRSGRDLPHAMMMLVPEAYEGRDDIDPARRRVLPIS